MAVEEADAAEEVRDEASADAAVVAAVVVFVVFVPEEKALPIKNMDNPIIIKIITRIKRRRKSMILRFLILACLLRSEGGFG